MSVLKAKETKTTRATFTVDTDDMAELEAIAKHQRVSVAWVIRDCIKQYLADRSHLLEKAVAPRVEGTFGE
jgi:predicted transcriptional regulator